MSMKNWLWRKLTACCLSAMMGLPLAQAAQVPQQQTVPGSQPSTITAPNDQPVAAAQPAANSTMTNPSGTANGRSQNATADSESTTPQSGSDQQENSVKLPIGVAAAPGEKTLGVSASRPAGAVIAPAKQRRVHSFAFRIAIVVGACVAVGTVVALSRASPSQPH